MSPWTDFVFHLVTVFFLPLLLPGIIGRTKAAFAGRQGAPLLQPYRDVVKLLGKQMVLSRTTSWVFLAGPAGALAAVLGATLLLPLGGREAPVHFAGDFVVFAGLLAFARFALALAALDTGSAFEGMGAARELGFGALAEPALFLGLLALVDAGGSLELSGMIGAGIGTAWMVAAPTMVMVTVGLFIIVLAENARIPVDDPNTHLELTMIHEVMVLDHSGPALAVIHYGAALKLLAMGSLVVRIVLPLTGQAPLVGWGLFLVGIVGFGLVVGVVESVMARVRLTLVPNLIVGAATLTGFGLVLLLMR